MKKDNIYRMIMVDDDIMHHIDSYDLYPLVKLMEEKKYTPIPANDSLVLGLLKNSLVVIFPTFKDIEDDSLTSRAIELFDENIFRNRYSNMLFKLVLYKGYKLIIDDTNTVVRYTSREEKITIKRDVESIEILEDGLNYEESFKMMQKIMIEELKKNKEKNNEH